MSLSANVHVGKAPFIVEDLYPFDKGSCILLLVEGLTMFLNDESLHRLQQALTDYATSRAVEEPMDAEQRS